MPENHNGKEIACHLVSLQPLDPEYQKVLATYKKAKGLQFNLSNRMISIQRVQNPNLYVQYAKRKDTIDRQNPNIRTERWLFCCCEENDVENICHQGFNKSIASRSSTMFGGGVSFSVAAQSNSLANKECVFYARILTGDYTEGHGLKGLVAPPPKNPRGHKTILYDSVVDNLKRPCQYVVFSNDQSYPDYLITETLFRT